MAHMDDPSAASSNWTSVTTLLAAERRIPGYATLAGNLLPMDPHPTYVVDYGWDWCGRGSSHVEFTPNERVPLEEGRHLGHGVHGPVFQSECLGHAVAWKRKYVRRTIGTKELGEIEILKKLRHRHIIDLVGTYTKGPYLGLLLFPVAHCDLGSFLEDMDQVQKERLETPESIASRQRLVDLLTVGHYEELKSIGLPATLSRYLLKCVGCLASAISYLHTSEVKHKDLKPANILLGALDRLWLTDFGASSEFSDFAHSATEGGERGTPKYFAPEVAAYRKAGRSADVFSLGCILLEIIAVSEGYSLEELRSSRPHEDHSFQANLQNVLRWLDSAGFGPKNRCLMTEVRMMLRQEPRSRPTVQHLVDTISVVGGQYSFYSRQCCAKPIMEVSDYAVPILQTIGITFGNTWEGQQGDRHRWSFFIWPSELDVIDKIWCFLHPSCREPQRVLSDHPFQFYSNGWGMFQIDFAVFLKPCFRWAYSNRMILTGPSLAWSLQFDQPIDETTAEFQYYKINLGSATI